MSRFDGHLGYGSDNGSYQNLADVQAKREKEEQELLAQINAELDGGRIFNGHRKTVRDLKAKQLATNLTAAELHALDMVESKVRVLEACHAVLTGGQRVTHLEAVIGTERAEHRALYAINTSVVRGGFFKANSATYDIAEKVLARFGSSHRQISETRNSFRSAADIIGIETRLL